LLQQINLVVDLELVEQRKLDVATDAIESVVLLEAVL
jgi:hypothetical protein